MSCQNVHTITKLVTTWVKGKIGPTKPMCRSSHVANAACPTTAISTKATNVLLRLHPFGCIFRPKCTATRSGRLSHTLMSLSSSAAARHQITGMASLTLMNLHPSNVCFLRLVAPRVGLGRTHNNTNRHSQSQPQEPCAGQQAGDNPQHHSQNQTCKRNLFHDFSIRSTSRITIAKRLGNGVRLPHPVGGLLFARSLTLAGWRFV